MNMIVVDIRFIVRCELRKMSTFFLLFKYMSK